MVKRAKAAAKPMKAPAKREKTAPKFPRVANGELLTLLDFVRFAVSRFVEAKLTFAHGTTDPTAEAAFLVCEALHLCTGSGCLAVLASRHFPNARIDAVDLSEDALDVAARNVAAYNLEDQVTLYHGDLFAPLGEARYDLIISNPPYVDAEGMAALPRECSAEPKLAFDGGADGLDIVRRILDEAPAHLTAQGGLLCEIGRGRDRLERAFPQSPLLWLDSEDSEGEVFWIAASDPG